MGTGIHGTVCLLVGFIYAVMVPMFPGRGWLWAGIVLPLFWSGLFHATGRFIDPALVDELIEKFLAACHIRRFGAKAAVIRQGDPSRDLFYVVKGSVTVLLEETEGRELVLAYLNPGEFFGELGNGSGSH